MVEEEFMQYCTLKTEGDDLRARGKAYALRLPASVESRPIEYFPS